MTLRLRIRIAAALAALAAGCAAPQTQDTAALTDDARRAAAGLQQQLAGKLMAAMQAGGPASAIEVCKTLAPEAAGLKSRETGWWITRVSLKPRNPALGAPDAWEQRVLAGFDARAPAARNRTQSSIRRS